MPQDPLAIWINYKNHRGEKSLRNVVPRHIWHGTTSHHPEPQWFLKAWDLGRSADRDFALADVYRIALSPPEGAPAPTSLPVIGRGD